MADIVLREIGGDEMLEIAYRFSSYAFGPSPPFPDKLQRLQDLALREKPFYFALFENGSPVACVAGTQLIQQVRGHIYAMGGVFDVVTLPQARRKGYSRRLMQRLFEESYKREQPFSCLYPFKETFYERMGYVPFQQPLKVIFSSESLSALLTQDLEGEVELLLLSDGYDLYREFLYRLQQEIHGMSLFEYSQKAVAQSANRFWLALAKVDGEIVGLMLYSIQGEMVTQFKLRATRFYYLNAQGKYLLLEWLARHVNQAREIELWLAPFERAETWLADIRPRWEPAFFAPMGRVIDIAALNGMAVGLGRFSARVTDPLCGWNQGTWRFESTGGKLQVSPAKRATCEMTIQGLSALVYGTNDPGDFHYRGWGSPSTGIQAVMRSMFPIMTPYLHEMY